MNEPEPDTPKYVIKVTLSENSLNIIKLLLQINRFHHMTIKPSLEYNTFVVSVYTDDQYEK